MPILVSQKLLLLKDDKGAIINFKLLEKTVNMSFSPFKGLHIRDEFGDVYSLEYNYSEYYAPEDSLYVVLNEVFYDEKSRDDVAKMHISQNWKLSTCKFRKKHYHGPAYPAGDETPSSSYYSLEGDNYHFHPSVVGHK